MEHRSVESRVTYFIKTGNTDSIEVQRLSGGSTYSQFDIQAASGFSAKEVDNGVLTIVNGDLYFIKTRNTDSGKVEVHMADHQKKFVDVDSIP